MECTCFWANDVFQSSGKWCDVIKCTLLLLWCDFLSPLLPLLAMVSTRHKFFPLLWMSCMQFSNFDSTTTQIKYLFFIKPTHLQLCPFTTPLLLHDSEYGDWTSRSNSFVWRKFYVTKWINILVHMLITNVCIGVYINSPICISFWCRQLDIHMSNSNHEWHPLFEWISICVLWWCDVISNTQG